MTRSVTLAVLGIALSASTASAFAQGSNDFFGTSLPGQQGGGTVAPPPGAAAAEQALSGHHGGGEYTADEKRMQKKFKGHMKAAKLLISKAERMIKDGERRKNEKVLKKGKILKEIAEKRLAELQENSPLPEKKM